MIVTRVASLCLPLLSLSLYPLPFDLLFVLACHHFALIPFNFCPFHYVLKMSYSLHSFINCKEWTIHATNRAGNHERGGLFVLLAQRLWEGQMQLSASISIQRRVIFSNARDILINGSRLFLRLGQSFLMVFPGGLVHSSSGICNSSGKLAESSQSGLQKMTLNLAVYVQEEGRST